MAWEWARRWVKGFGGLVHTVSAIRVAGAGEGGGAFGRRPVAQRAADAGQHRHRVGQGFGLTVVNMYSQELAIHADGQLGYSTVFVGARPRDVVRFDALRTSPDGTLYCLCTTGEFLKIDPDDASYEIIATPPQEPPRTMQPLDDRIYFPTGTRLGALHLD